MEWRFIFYCDGGRKKEMISLGFWLPIFVIFIIFHVFIL